MPHLLKICWAIAFVTVWTDLLPGQNDDRLPCGQDFIAAKWPVPTQENSIQQGPVHTMVRNQLVIPVVVHVVWRNTAENIPDARVISQIEALNRHFNAQNEDLDQVPEEFKDRIADIGISFCLASKTPWGTSTNGILRTHTQINEIGIKDSLFYDSTGGSSAWDAAHYLNIWVANTGKYIIGFGTYPNQVPPEKTGVVVSPQCFGLNDHPHYGLGRTLVHELGHYFGLKHVWSGDPLCEGDDGIEDTPKQMNPHSGCPTYPQASCTPSDLFMDFMDYVEDPCMLMFTKGQKDRIWDNILAFRPGLLDNSVEYYCLPSNPPDAPSFAIAPNPVSMMLHLQFSEAYSGLTEIQVFDVMGRLRIHINTIVHQEIEIAATGLEAGIYFVKAGTVGKVFVKQ